MTSPTHSRYSQLAPRNVVDIEGRRLSRLGGVERGSHHRTREPTILARFASGDTIDLGFLMKLPELATPLAEAFLAVARTLSTRTRSGLASDLKTGFVAFLVATERYDCRLEDIDQSLVNAFGNWLDRVSGRGVAVLAETTREDKFGALRRLFVPLKNLYPRKIGKSVHVQKGRWIGSSRKAIPTPIIDHESWVRLWAACRTEILDQLELSAEGERLIQDGIERLPKNPSTQGAYRELDVFLAAVSQLYPGPLPSEDDMHKEHRHLANAQLVYHRRQQFLPYLYPLPRQLVPFVLILAMYTLFNGDGLLKLRLSQIKEQSVFGEDRVVFSIYKGRNESFNPRSFAIDRSDPLNPASLVAYLKKWTARIRPFARPEMQDRLFLFVPAVRSEKVPRSYEHEVGPTSDCTWSFHVTEFLKTHGLPHLRTRHIRKTGLDLVHELFSGDIRAVAAAGGQRSADVLDKHYTDDRARRRNDESLGSIMAARERELATGGRINPRHGPTGSDYHAATPGAMCLDPFNSPQPGQKAGRLCRAYGACWACPLLQLKPDQPYQLARAWQFRTEILNSRGYLPASRWVAAWQPRLTALEKHVLPAFEEEAVIAAATRLLPHLPPLPRLD